MIPSRSGRRLPRDLSRSLQHAREQLLMPWLCPALYTASQSASRPRIDRRGTATTSIQRPTAPVRAQTSPAATLQSLRKDRQYAHAASSSLQTSSPDDFYVPIVADSSMSASWTHMPPETSFFDGSSPLILDENTQTKRQKYRQATVALSDNDLRTAHQTLEACLTVGFYPRAAAALRSLNAMYKPEIEEILGLNNFYIGHMLGLHITTGDPTILSEVTKWYHVDMLKSGIRPNASTYALMIQVVMRDPDGSRAARSVRRFANTASEDGMIDLVIEELQNVVPPGEYKELVSMAPETFKGSSSNVEETEATAASGVQANHLDEAEIAKGASLSAQAAAAYDMPRVTPTLQKGNGLEILRQSLATFIDAETQQSNAKTKSSARSPAAIHQANMQRQLQLEEDARLAALKKWEEDINDALKRGAENPAMKRNSVQRLIRQWHKNLVPLMQEKIAAPEDLSLLKGSAGAETFKARKDLLSYQPYLRLLDPERAAITTITTVLHTLASDRQFEWVPAVRLCMNIGRNLEREVAKKWAASRKLNRFVKANMKRKGSHASRGEGSAANIYRTVRHLVPDDELPPEWTKHTLVQVGAAALECFLRIAVMEPKADIQAGAKASKPVPALVHKVAFMKGRRVGVVVGDPGLIKILTMNSDPTFMTKNMPMLVPPKPWTAYAEGGYLNQNIPVVRLQTECFQSHEYVKVAIEQGDMKTALEGLDTLGRVPWIVNREVFEVLAKVWNAGEAFAKMPAAHPELDLPESPPDDAPKMAKIKHYRAMQMYSNKLGGLHSERCYQNFQLETARAYLNDVFYLPHNVDFRGRAYPLPSYFNQMGSDNCRGLLMFAEGKELGQRGLRWLKIHLANLYGFDKASLDERLAFADEHLDDAFDSANNPLEGGQGWWKKADKPWQCLATCLELRNAYRLADPTKYASRLPVHQDGTCNGLQHYAALGGDEIGARQVNLEPGERPSDIYSAVANHVRQAVVADAEAGNAEAEYLKDKITRKVVKQPVMTSVYGVTHRGAQEQIAKQLDELIPSKILLADANRYRYSNYLANKTFDAMNAIFNGAAAIQQWLGDCASGVCTSVAPDQISPLREFFVVKPSETVCDVELAKPFQGNTKSVSGMIEEHTRMRTSVIWTTPLRIPVVQPYRKDSVHRVMTELQDISLRSLSSTSVVDKRKQLQAFAPNYIHSLDATHMLLSAQRCEEAGLRFAAVHDSFWTHACDVDTMNVVLRNAFVQMHSEDIVGRLASEFANRYKGHIRKQRVKRYSPLGEALFKLRKASNIPLASSGLQDAAEIVLESERQRLLNSDDATQRALGAGMMTPARLCAEAAASDWEVPAGVEPIPRGPRKKAEEKAIETREEAEDEEEEADHFNLAMEADSDQDDAGSFDMTPELIPASERIGLQVPDNLDVPDGYVSLSKLLKRSRKAPKQTTYIEVWVPLDFPPVPEKGKWDIARLRESKYFFS